MLTVTTRILITSLLALSHQAAFADTTTSPSGSSEQVIIDGVTNFLADRAQANAAYIFQNRLKNNRALACYLPNTYTAIINAELISLIKANSEIWRDRLANDLKYTTILLLLQKYEDNWNDLTPSEFDNLANNIANYLTTQTRFENSRNKNKLTEDEIKTLAKSRTNEVAEDILKISLRAKKLVGRPPQYYLRNVKNEKGEPVPVDCFGNIPFTNIVIALNSLSTALMKAANNIPSAPNNFDTLGKYLDLYSGVTSLFNSIQNKNYSSAAIQLTGLICTHGNNPDGCHPIAESDDEDSGQPGNGNRKLPSQILFFAAIADAKTSDQVTQTLQNFMMPPVSFGEIREESHVAIASYVGVYGTNDREQKQTSNSRGTLGIYAPIGVQISRSCPSGTLSEEGDFFQRSRFAGLLPCGMGGSVGLMISPFDFGYPISLKANGSNNVVTWSDVINPSVAVSFGLKDAPINWGVAWQKVNKNLNNTNSGSRILFFLSLDMPLHLIH